MDFNKILDAVSRHLRQRGVTPLIVPQRLASKREIAKAEAKMKLCLPAELAQFYQTVGNGYALFWQPTSQGEETKFGSFQVPSLNDLASGCLSWRKLVLYSPEAAEKYGFPHTKDPALAKRTAARMWHWLPVIAEENGDAISHDLSDQTCPVVFDEHDWLDGGSGENGHVLAANWYEFVKGWGSVCFQMPKCFWWPSCFRAGGGVDWDGEEFDDTFHVANLV